MDAPHFDVTQRQQRLAARRTQINSNRVDFFTLVRGDNA